MKATILALSLVFLSLALALTGPHVYAETLTLTSNPDCASWGQDRIDCVARGPDNALWHTAWISGTWGGWESFGGNLTSGPSIVSPAPGLLDMFARGPDNRLWHVIWDGSLHSWESLGGILTSDPDCTSGGFGIIDCLVRGPDKALWRISFKGGTWSAWESAGGVLISGPGAASVIEQGVSFLEVSVRGADNAMWQTSWSDATQGWSPWEKLGGILTSDPDVVGSNDPQYPVTYRLDYVVRGPGNGIWWKWWNNAIGWSTGCQGCDGYENLGGISNSGPTIVSRAWSHLDVFTLGTDNKLYHRGWAGQGNQWSPWDAVPMTLTPVSTSSTITSTSSEESITTSVSSTSMEATSLTAPPESTNTNLGTTTDLAGMLQQYSVLIIGLALFIVIVAIFASRARHKQLESLKPQQPRTNIFCPSCGAQNPATNEFCRRCGARFQ